jgi:hypothetical protein
LVVGGRRCGLVVGVYGVQRVVVDDRQLVIDD